MALAYVSRRSAWMSRTAATWSLPGANPTAAFLMPFLALLAAGMLGHAASSGFDWLYPLRLVACAAALWFYRRPLAAQDWRCSWRGALAGVAMFAAWVLCARFVLAPAGMPAALAQLPRAASVGWVVARAVAAIVTVPLAEELAFRGFLLRRWQCAAFESLDLRAVRWPALVLTSLLFGLSHGAMWPEGMLAGLVYGGLAIRTGRLGECVLAHATTNALLAALVLIAGQWQYWQ
jgi:CAAX prenyl protease-like protein